jgi:hypothetical protein
LIELLVVIAIIATRQRGRGSESADKFSHQLTRSYVDQVHIKLTQKNVERIAS